MQVFGHELGNLKILSLQEGHIIATTTQLILDPANLSMVGWRCVLGRNQERILLLNEVRRYSRDGVIVNSGESLSETSDLVRHEAVLKKGLTLLGMDVVTELGRRLGKVSDYTVNVETNYVQKLCVKPMFWRSFFTDSLHIDRAQITEVGQRAITVRDSQVPAQSTVLSQGLPN